jgi:hypothetical protein
MEPAPIDWGAVARFYAIACVGPTAAGLLAWFLAGEGPSATLTALAGVAMMCPLVATWWVHGGIRPWLRPSLDRWLLVAAGLPVLVAGLTIAAAALLPGVVIDPTLSAGLDRVAHLLGPDELAAAKAQVAAFPGGPGALLGLGALQAVVAGSTINAVMAFGEEVGWRGWLHRELAPLGFWSQNLSIGVMWGLWHAPLVLNGHNHPDHPVAGVFVFTAVCMAISVVVGWLRDRSTVWHAAVFHGVVNAVATVAILPVAGPDLLIGLQGVAGLLSFAVVAGILRIMRR